MIPFLEERKHIKERLSVGVDYHASDAEYNEFMTLAKIISPNNIFYWRGCHSCGQELMNFVFNNESKIESKTKK